MASCGGRRDPPPALEVSCAPEVRMTERDRSSRGLAAHVQPRVDAARLARQWSAIAERIEPEERRGVFRSMRWPALAFVVVAIAVVLGFVFKGRLVGGAGDRT